MRAKYTPRTNLRFMLSVFRPCREQSHAGVTYTNVVAFGYAGYGNEFTTISLILSVHTPFQLSEEGEESTLTTRHSFIQMTKLSNVRGRITYISSHAKQEHLYAVYETTDRNYWTELARCSQQEFKKSGVDGKCIEARELIIALPESLYEQGMPDMLLKSFTDKFKEKYGVECVVALHHNKRMTNFHKSVILPKTSDKSVMTPEAAAYPKLKKIKAELDKQNNLIFQAEQQRGNLEIELSDLKGLAKITRKAELQRKIEEKTDYINRLKIGLSNMVSRYGYENMNEFLLTLKESKTAYEIYQQAVDNWNKPSDHLEIVFDEAETIYEKLDKLKKDTTHSQQYSYKQKKDRTR